MTASVQSPDSPRRPAARRGQAMVEFAMVAVVAIFVLLVAIQYAMIGQAALALSQAAFQGARYASVNTNASSSDVQTYLFGSGTSQGVASPTISKGGGKYLTFSMNPATTPRTFGQTVVVNLSFDVCGSGMLVLGKCGGTFLGIAFPQTLTAAETAMSE